MSRERASILFVDDEKGILKALQRLFFDEDWDLFFAESGNEGLELLKQNKVDLVVSDVRMPEMDGIAFLQEVKKRYPEIVRIFLSGYADQQAVTSALAGGFAQQLLPKPWDDTELKHIIQQALQQAVRQQKNYQGLQKVINSISSLPAMPATYLKAMAKIIEKEITLSAELIHWANSAIFGQMSKVESVKRALVVLGTDIVEGIILSRSITDCMPVKKQPFSGFNRNDFKRHSFSTAIMARRLVKTIEPDDPADVDRAFTAGLLHDIGKLLEEVYFTKEFQHCIDMARDQKVCLLSAEEEILGTTHEEIGAYLAEWWSMPSFLVNAIRWHHAPDQCSTDQDILAAVHVANVLSQKFNIGSSGNFCTIDVDETAWNCFDISYDQFDSLNEEVMSIIS
ncbi:HDOD domain-containing protein [Thermodesulfobacteriota bacterium]